MLSVIEVTCPHCGAKGQIMLPPVSTLIVGPCPECQGLVVVFCGNVLPLDKDLMLTGVVEEKREHLMNVLSEFLRERIWQMVPEEGDEASDLSMEDSKDVEHGQGEGPVPELEPELEPAAPPLVHDLRMVRPPITQEEIQSFVGKELSLLDNPVSFRALFD